VPRLDIGTVEGARVCVGLAVAVDEIASTDDSDVAALHHLHVGLSMLAKAVPPDLWPSFAAGGEHDTAPVAQIGHG
jgi:predicted anti-sigma-YlaC factor YlaD